MRALCTTCSAEKRLDPEALPAVQRYAHPRIAWCREEAERRGVPLLILSGLFGLLEAGDRIPVYDHILQYEEVAERLPGVIATLERLGVTELVLVAEPETTLEWGPYHEVIRRACARARVRLTLETWQQTDG